MSIQPATVATWYAQIVGQVIRVRRVELGVNQVDLGKTLSMTASGWSRVELGKTVVTVGKLRPAARLLSMTSADIIRAADRATAWLEGYGVTVCDYETDIEPPLIGMAVAGIRQAIVSSSPPRSSNV